MSIVQEPEFPVDLLGDSVFTAAALIPHSREAEEGVLGGVFINPDLMTDVFDILQAPDFYIHRHRWVYEAMIERFVNAEPIDLLTIADTLERAGKLSEIGGPAFLTGLVNQVPSSWNVEHYARIVEGYAIRRRIIEKANESAQKAYDVRLPLETVIKDVDAVWEDRPSPSKTTLITASVAALQLEERIDLGRPMAVPTGLSIPDSDFGGFPLQALTMFVADYSTGKTALLLQACETLNYAGDRPLYITLEEPAWKMVSRRVFPNAGVDRVAFRTGTMTPGQKAALKDAVNEYIASHERLAFDQTARTVEAIRRSVRQHRAKLVIVDDLLHVHSEKKERGENETMALIRTAVKLKDIAIDENCAMVLIHHLSNEDSAKFSPLNGKKPSRNIPPSITNIPWATTLRFTIDMWLALVPDFQADISSDVVEMVLWALKDKESARMKSEIHLWYDKIMQWWYDRNSRNLMTTKQVVSQMPKVTP